MKQAIGVLCSGGDSPGMNPAIRAVVRTGIYHGLSVWGIHQGYDGLLKDKMELMSLSSVGNIIQRGGTILQTSRSEEFLLPEFRKKAVELLQHRSINCLIVIGGDGSFNGAHKLSSENDNYPVIGIPGTIDNDISNSEYTIGFDTAVQTAIEAVDRIRDTASSHARTFLVEVMGRNSSAIAQKVGICTGAENVILPTGEVDYKSIVEDIKRGIARGKNSSIIIVAEGPVAGRSYQIQKDLKEKYKIKTHVCILGHIQRGGSPSSNDRLIASQMGHMAVKAFLDGKSNMVTVVQNGQVTMTELKNCLIKTNDPSERYIDLAKTLSI